MKRLKDARNGEVYLGEKKGRAGQEVRKEKKKPLKSKCIVLKKRGVGGIGNCTLDHNETEKKDHTSQKGGRRTKGTMVHRSHIEAAKASPFCVRGG